MSLAVPNTLEEVLDPGWVTEALRQRFPGITVVSVQPGPVVSRVSTNARFHIECKGPLPQGLSADLCVKGYFTDWSDTADASRSAGVPEALFYRHLVDVTGVRTLDCFYADVDPETQHGVIITGDVAAQGAIFLDALSEYSSDQVAQSLEQYAILHGRTWAAKTLEQPWLSQRLEMTMKVRGVREIRGNFEGPIGALVPDQVRDAERLVEAVQQLAHLAGRAEPLCLLQGDAHVGNVYLDAAGDPCLVDWQLVQHGPWYLDVGYHLGCTMAPDERRRTESELLRHYLACLSAQGVDAPSWDEAWHQIRLGMVYGFFLWAITLKVAPQITTVMLERLGSATADHDGFSSLVAP